MMNVRFFAVDDDLRQVLAAVESRMDLQYVTTRGYPRQTVERYLRAADIPAGPPPTIRTSTSSVSRDICSQQDEPTAGARSATGPAI